MAAFIFFTASCGSAQLLAQLRFDNLGIADGLSQSSVHHILQDHLGFMWFATDDGLNRYDGYRFKIFRYERDNDRSILSAKSSTVFEDSRGTIWAIGADGISRYVRDSDCFYNTRFVQPVSRNHPVTPVERNGFIFFTADELLYQLDEKTGALSATHVGGAVDPSIMCGLADGRFLLRDSRRKLMLYQPFTKALTELSGDILPGGRICAVPVGDNYVWLAGDSQLLLYNLAAGMPVKQMSQPETSINCAAFDARGYLWLGGTKGVYRIDTARMQTTQFSASAQPFSLAGNYIISLLADRSGVLWIGTNDGGLSKMSYQKFKFGTVSGLAGKGAVSLAEDGSGNVWLGTEQGNISVCNMAAKTLVRCDRSTGCALHAPSYILSLFCDGDIMYCGHEDGVDAISISRRKVISYPLMQSSTTVKQILRDAGGGLWALGAKSLFRFDKSQQRFKPAALPRLTGRMQNMIDDGRGSLWLGSDEGLLRYNLQSGTLQDYGRKFPGLLGGNVVIGLCLDNSGALWVGACDVGLLRYNSAADSFQLINSKTLPNSSIYALACDKRGDLWLTTNAGVSCYHPSSGTFTHYNAADGLLSNEGIGRAILRDSRGTLWFGNAGGANTIDPASIPHNAMPPVPRITGFKVFDKDQPFQEALRNGGIRLRQAQNYFTLEYAAMDYTEPDENSYRIMLEGFDKDWRPRSKTNSVSYTNLDGGHYTFRLQAYNSDGVPSAQLLELPIYIAPHFYSTWWFYLLVALVLISGAYSFYRYRINELKKELRLRTTIASDLHDDVGATLSSIKMLATMLRPKLQAAQVEVGDAVDTIHLRAGSTLEAMSDIVWSINPKNDAGEHLVLRMKTYAAELLDESDIDYRFFIGEGAERLKFRQQVRKEAYLIFKEALNNAMKYAAATHIEISVRKAGQRLFIEVADNGRGFDPQAMKATTKGGNGLKNMEARAQSIGAILRIQSAPGKGTAVLLDVSLTQSR